MPRPPVPPPSGRFTLICLLGLFLANTVLAQDPAGSTKPRPKAGRPKVSELRGDEKDPADEVSKSAAKPDPKKQEEAAEKPVGFFGDPKKFTKLGGWGSFGNAMGQFGFARATLIMMPPVQEELKLTDEQKKKIKEWQETMRKKGEEMGRKMREKNGDDPFKGGDNVPIMTRITQFTSMMEQVSSFVKENESGLAKILKAPQRKRLDQIALQMEGISALTRPEIADSLALMEDQQEQIRQILNQSRAQQMTTWIGSMMSMRPPRRPGQAGGVGNSNSNPSANPAEPARPGQAAGAPVDDSPEAQAKARAAREKAMKQGFETMRDRTDKIHAGATKEIINVLTRSQRAKFELMLGPPFDPTRIKDLGRPPRSDGQAAPARPSAEVEKNAKAGQK